MKTNEAAWDRIARAVLGLATLVVSSTFPVSGALAVALAIVGSILLVTAVAGRCLLYDALGIRTRGPAAGR